MYTTFFWWEEDEWEPASWVGGVNVDFGVCVGRESRLVPALGFFGSKLEGVP